MDKTIESLPSYLMFKILVFEFQKGRTNTNDEPHLGPTVKVEWRK